MAARSRRRSQKKNAQSEGGWHVVAERQNVEAAIGPQLGFSMLTP